MKIVRIFDLNLLSFKYDDKSKDEFKLLFSLWNDVEYLECFFETNKKYLKDPFWKGISIEEAIEITLEEAQLFEDILIELSGKDNIYEGLEKLFTPLLDTDIHEIELKKSKAKRKWLRLYALKIEPNAYVVTGGAIKLTKTMQGGEDTRKELRKIDQCRDFLKQTGSIDLEGICEAFGL